jgi:hypothetical protein
MIHFCELLDVLFNVATLANFENGHCQQVRLKKKNLFLKK